MSNYKERLKYQKKEIKAITTYNNFMCACYILELKSHPSSFATSSFKL